MNNQEIINLLYNRKIKHIAIHYDNYIDLFQNKFFKQFMDFNYSKETLLEGNLGKFLGINIWKHDILNEIKISLNDHINWSVSIPFKIISLINNDDIEQSIERYKGLYHFS